MYGQIFLLLLSGKQSSGNTYSLDLSFDEAADFSIDSVKASLFTASIDNNNDFNISNIIYKTSRINIDNNNNFNIFNILSKTLNININVDSTFNITPAIKFAMQPNFDSTALLYIDAQEITVQSYIFSCYITLTSPISTNIVLNDRSTTAYFTLIDTSTDTGFNL